MKLYRGFEIFVDSSYYDIIGVRSQGQTKFEDTHHFKNIDEAISFVNLFEAVRNLQSIRLPLQNEKETQSAIERFFIDRHIEFKREFHFDSKNKVDFFALDRVAIEIKIKGNARSIYKQCERYCQFQQVQELILITNRSMGFPEKINGKPCFFINIGKAWL